MTREKAIEHFERYVNNDCYTKEHQEACRMAVAALQNQGWISVKERLPDEHISMFSDFYGTDRWIDGMFRKCSDEVIVCVKTENEEKFCTTASTHDGKWSVKIRTDGDVVTHWIPFPKMPVEN